jgi:hypothetical protein
MSNFLSKQRKAANNVKLTKEATHWEGSTMQTPARHLRNTTYIYDFGSNQPKDNILSPWPPVARRGTTRPE